MPIPTSWRLKISLVFLTPLTGTKNQFIKGWYAAARSRFSLRDADLKQRIPDLIDRVENQPHCGNSPNGRIIDPDFHLARQRRTLTRDRAQLYKNSVDLLLYQWRQEVFRDSDGQPLRLDDGELLRCLQTLAITPTNQRRRPDLGHTADISRASILEAFDPMLESWDVMISCLFATAYRYTDCS